MQSHPGDLNPKPAAYEAAALPFELGWRLRAGDGIRTHDLLLGKEMFYH
jgi:hypothetical protein